MGADGSNVCLIMSKDGKPFNHFAWGVTPPTPTDLSARARHRGRTLSSDPTNGATDDLEPSAVDLTRGSVMGERRLKPGERRCSSGSPGRSSVTWRSG